MKVKHEMLITGRYFSVISVIPPHTCLRLRKKKPRGYKRLIMNRTSSHVFGNQDLLGIVGMQLKRNLSWDQEEEVGLNVRHCFFDQCLVWKGSPERGVGIEC